MKWGLDLDTATAKNVYTYCEAVVPHTWASRSQVRKAFNAYWRVTGRQDPPSYAIHVPPEPEFYCRAIPDWAARKLSDVAYHWDQGAEGLGVLFGLHTALRRFETAKIEWHHITRDNEAVWLAVTGKGGRLDHIPLNWRVVERLDWWRGWQCPNPQLRHTRPGDQYVFLGFRGRPIHPHTINEWTKKLAAEAGIGELASHELRHTCLANINDKTRDLRGTQKFARHRNPNTTARYTRVEKQRLLEVASASEY